MPDLEKLDQIYALAKVLASMPPNQPGGQRIPLPKPKLAQWATELVELHGVRVHDELATMELVADGDTVLGARPQRLVERVDADRLLTLLRDVGSEQNVPSLVALADRIEAAATDEERKIVIDDIARENPGLISTAMRHFDEGDPARIFGQ